MSYLDRLKEVVLIDKKTVNRIHEYVKTKYPQGSSSEKSEVLEDAFNRIADRKLKGLAINHKESVVGDLAHKAVQEEDKHITRLDVVEICIKDVDINDQVLEALSQWNEDVFGRYTNEESGEFLKEVRNLHTNQQSEIVKNRKHQDVLAKKDSGIISKLKEKYQEIKKLISEMTPSKALKVSKASFIFILIFSCGFFYYHENTGLAEVNSEDLKSTYVKEAAAAYNEYLDHVEKEEIEYDILACHPFLPEYFDYVDVDEEKVKEYLNNRNSILTDDKYFYDIIKTSKEFNLNPLILFAITGQEQGFVPRTDKEAEKIANNPFNVFVSWRHYNKTLKDSSEIAARTVINLAKGNDSNINVFKWINRLYADDPDWYKGVQTLFEDMMEFCGVEQQNESK